MSGCPRECRLLTTTGAQIGAGVRHPGPIVQYVWRGMSVPVWVGERLPSSEVTPVRARELEEMMDAAVAEFERAVSAPPVDLLTAIRDTVKRMRG